MTSQPRHDRTPTRLAEDELANVSGGATEELKGAHNFLLEVSGITPEQTASGFKPPIGSDKGS